MYVLGIDTATLVCSAAIAEPARIVSELTMYTRRTHSERLMPAIQQLISDAGLSPQDLGGIAVSIGPGSFTGLRIGITTAKSMAFALGIPVVGVPTLDALAAQFPYSKRIICPILDAQKGRVYTALYDTSEGYPRRLSEYEVLDIKELTSRVINAGEPVIISGEAADFSEQLQQVDPLLLTVASPLNRMPRGASSAVLGMRQLISGIGQDPQTLLPLYIRRSEAEELWEQRHSKEEADGTKASTSNCC